jgi:ATP-dependent phosphofructokinase / diphosphate-dependent phosphofructokinase
MAGISGRMATILRVSDDPYAVKYGHVPLEAVANTARKMPAEFIAPSGVDVTDAFIRYATPLIGGVSARHEAQGGLLRFARLDFTEEPKKLPDYVPENFV